MPWTVESDYTDPRTLGIEELGVTKAEWNPPGPGPERFNYEGLLFRTDVLSADPGQTTTPKMQEFLTEATTAALAWQQSMSWSDTDSGDVETALEAILP